MKTGSNQQSTPMWPTALAMGGFAAMRSLGPSMYARPRGLQIAETAISAGLGIGAGFAAENVVHAISRHSNLTERESRIATVAGAGALSLVFAAIASRSGGKPNRMLARALATGLGVGAFGAALGGATSVALNSGHQVDKDREHQSFKERLPEMSVIVGVAALGLVVGGWLLKKKMAGLQTPMPKVPQLDDAASLIKRSTLDIAQLRFVDTIPKDLKIEPLRVGVGLATAKTPTDRAKLAVSEAVRQGMLSREAILIDATTGGGHVNPVTVEAFERLFEGNVGTIAVQYGNMPSAFALHRVPVAHKSHEEVLRALKSEIDSLPAGAVKPKVFVFGESLGAWGSQDALVGGTKRLDELGVDKALWVGVPGYSQWHPVTDGAGTAFEGSKVEQLRERTAAELNGLRQFSFSNPNDPVHRASHRLMFEFPTWLRRPHAEGVPAKQQYTPGVTFFQAVGDVIASRDNTTAGQFSRTGHDYRLDITELMRDAFGLRTKVSDSTVHTITERLRQTDIASKSLHW